MFKEIENELLSILSDETYEKIAHMPTIEIAKTMELIFKIKFEDIQRVYTESMINNITRMTIVHNSNKVNKVASDICPINGKIYYITLIPASALNKSESNAIELSRTIISYVSNRVILLTDLYKNILEGSNTFLYKTILQCIPIITCSVLRKLYSGPTLSKLIYMSLTELLNTYKNLYTEEGINTILDLFDEGLTVTELLDGGFICSIDPDDPKYPGIWCNMP